MAERIPAWLRWSERLVMLLLLAAVLLLPVTSHPLLSRLMGGTLVAPPSVILAGLGLFLYLPSILFRRQLLPAEWLPLAAFLVVALVSTLLSFFTDLPDYKNISPYKEAAQSVLTLMVGMGCFFAFSAWARREQQFAWVFRLVNLTGLLIIIWSALQLYVMYVLDGWYPRWMLDIHNALSVRSLEVFWYTRRCVVLLWNPPGWRTS